MLASGHWIPLIRRLPGRGPRIALSFDDGPTPATTSALVALLARYNAKATFFLAGERAGQYPELVKSLVENGQDVFGHGWEHIRLDHAGPERLLADLEKVEAYLRQFRPTPSPYLVRLPYAAGRFVKWVHQTIHQWNQTAQIAHWSHSMKDWDLAMNCQTRSELEEACRAAVDRLQRRPRLSGAILLLHESAYDRPAPLTPYVAPVLAEKILEAFAVRGFTFVPIEPCPHPQWIGRFIPV
jgi:peptidoglycan-N-acetylglucosamine deacetylase